VEPRRGRDVHEPVRHANWTTIALIGGLLLLVLVVAYFATRGDVNQDKLGNSGAAATAEAPNQEKLCASKATYDLIKRDLFRRAAQLRGSDQAAYDQLSGYAVLRMENPVMESEDNSTKAVNCSGALSLDLPPGVAVVGSRRTLSSDVDYTVQPAADGSGTVVLLRNADAIVTPLATLSRTAQAAPQPSEVATNEAAPAERPAASSPAEPAATSAPATPRPGTTRPSFDCANARTRGELAVCSDAGLAALDRNMATQYVRSMGVATPQQQVLLRRTRDRFLGYRDRCPNNACIGDAYVGRMREIRDIMEGRWQPR
jgi:hypothetical protein